MRWDAIVSIKCISIKWGHFNNQKIHQLVKLLIYVVVPIMNNVANETAIQMTLVEVRNRAEQLNPGIVGIQSIDYKEHLGYDDSTMQ